MTSSSSSLSVSVPVAERIDLAFNILGMVNVVALTGFLIVATILWPAISGVQDAMTVEIPMLHVAFQIPTFGLQFVSTQPISNRNPGSRGRGNFGIARLFHSGLSEATVSHGRPCVKQLYLLLRHAGPRHSHSANHNFDKPL